MSTDEVQDAINSAVHDYTVSHDAMRSLPDPDDHPALEAEQDLRRTLVCSPDFEARVTAAVEAAGLAGEYRVTVSNALRGDQMFVVNEPAMEDYLRRLRQSRSYRVPPSSYFTTTNWPVNLSSLA